jgi:cysteine-rich repeat protein
MVLAMASAASADRLLTPVAPQATPGGRPSGIARAQPLALDGHALGALRAQANAMVEQLPLGVDRLADVVLKRFDPFVNTRAEVVGDDGQARRLPLPDQTYFSGTVRGEPDSRVYLVAAPGRVEGFVVSGGETYGFGPDGNGGHRSYALRDADAKAFPPPGDFCANDLNRGQVDVVAAHKEALAAAGFGPAPIVPVGALLLQADVAIETDTELRMKFSNDDGQTLSYLATLLAAVNTIYERDLSVRLDFSYIRLWSGTDPWTKTSTIEQLNEVRDYWIDPSNNMNSIAGSRDLVHFVSGKAVQGGVAYIDTLCDQSYGFGVSQVFGSFDLADPNDIWDVEVLAHELGHNFGSPHTHCYSPPIDRCYGSDNGPSCYSGPDIPSRGTIMSYCHLHSGGLSNIDLVFGSVVSARIATSVGAATCLANASNCGNGTIDAGEECDDGNAVGGDGCSVVCRFEVCGNGYVDVGESCDDGNTVSGDGCSDVCIREPRCGDGFVDPGEECDDHNVVSGDGCSDVCIREPRCGDGYLDPGEECDDGNTVRDDGCSSGCHVEACAVLSPLQTIWAQARLDVARGAAGDRLAMTAGFGMPATAGAMALDVTGMRLIVEGAAGGGVVNVTVPPGAGWVHRKSGWTYKDKTGAAGGVRKIRIRERHLGAVADVKVIVSARNGAFPFGPLDLPPVMTLVFGDSGAGQVGACGVYVYNGASCRIMKHGARLACK